MDIMKLRSLFICVILSMLVHGISVPSVQAEGLTITALSAGYNHTLALRSDGTVWAWGDNQDFQLGFEGLNRTQAARQVKGLGSIRLIAAGGNFSLAVDDNGTVWGWGANASRVFKNSLQKKNAKPVQIMNDKRIKSITAGEANAVILTEDGAVYTWGDNTYGQLGVDNLISVNSVSSQKVEPLSGIVAIESGPYHSLALQDNGTVWEWGYSAYGYSAVPRKIPASKKIASLSVSWEQLDVEGVGVSYIRDVNGVWMKLENESVSPMFTYKLSSDMKRNADGYIISENGAVYAQDGSTVKAVKGLTNVKQIEAGLNFFAALKENGEVWTWKKRENPVQVNGFSSEFVFIDIENHWAKEYIYKLSGRNIVAGYEDGTYRPEDPVTREQFLKMLMTARPQLLEINKLVGTRQTFEDVQLSRWSHPYVEAALNAQLIIEGDYDGGFKPNQSINRLEMALIIGRTLGSSIYGALQVPFSDADEVSSRMDQMIQAPSKGRTLEAEKERMTHNMNYVFTAGLFSGYSDNSFRPMNTLTRAQAAKVVSMIMQ